MAEAVRAGKALAWLLARGEHAVPIPGTKRTAHLLDNTAAADLNLPEDAMAMLDALPAPAAPRYYPNGTEDPVMRVMHFTQYGDPDVLVPADRPEPLPSP